MRLIAKTDIVLLFDGSVTTYFVIYIYILALKK